MIENILGISKADFFSKYWEKEHLHSSGNLEFVSDLFTKENLSEIIDNHYKDLKYPLFRLVKNGEVVPEIKITTKIRTERQGEIKRLSISKINKHLKNGNTLIINSIERYNLNLKKLKDNFNKFFNETIQINLYLSQPNIGGVKLHYDPHEIFVIQVDGEKTWEIYESTFEKPLRNQRYFNQKSPTSKPTFVNLKKGDILYIPRGYWHRAKTKDKSSLHLTLGVYSITKSDIAKIIVNELENKIQFRNYFRSVDDILNNKDKITEKDISVLIKETIETLKEIAIEPELVEKCNEYYISKTFNPANVVIPFIN